MDAERVVEVFTSKEWEEIRVMFLAECVGAETNRCAEERKKHLDTLIQIRDILSKAKGIDPNAYDRVCRCIKILGG